MVLVNPVGPSRQNRTVVRERDAAILLVVFLKLGDTFLESDDAQALDVAVLQYEVDGRSGHGEAASACDVPHVVDTSRDRRGSHLRSGDVLHLHMPPENVPQNLHACRGVTVERHRGLRQVAIGAEQESVHVLLTPLAYVLPVVLSLDVGDTSNLSPQHVPQHAEYVVPHVGPA